MARVVFDAIGGIAANVIKPLIEMSKVSTAGCSRLIFCQLLCCAVEAFFPREVLTVDHP